MMAGALAGALILATSACSSSINADLLTEITASAGQNVRLDAVVDGDWDSFLVVCPYDPDVNERLGFEWDAAPDTNASDSSQMIVFVDDQRVVSTSQFRFGDIDLCTDVWPLMPSDTELQFTQPANHVWHARF
jgi:hypothetical protein